MNCQIGHTVSKLRRNPRQKRSEHLTVTKNASDDQAKNFELHFDNEHTGKKVFKITCEKDLDEFLQNGSFVLMSARSMIHARPQLRLRGS